MITYSYLTKQQLLDGNYARKVDSDDSFKESGLNYLKDYSSDEIVGVIAQDEEKIIGRTFLAYTDILVGDQLVRCAVGNNLYVTESYRKQAVGIRLLWKFMKLGIPYIGANASSDSHRLFLASKQFHLIDDSPLFVGGVSIGGSARIARLALQRESKEKPGVSMLRQFLVLATKVLNGLRLQYSSSRALSKLSPGEAEAILPDLVNLRVDKVYLPWNRNILIDALTHKIDNPCVWVVTHKKDTVVSNYLVTIYMVTRKLSIFKTKDIRTVKVARLTEVFPPVPDTETAEAVLAFAAQQARHRGATTLAVCANTDSFRETCGTFGFENLSQKSVWFTPGNAKGKVIDRMSDPENWWCRGMDETQFEETYLPVNAPRSLNEQLTLV